MEFVDIMLIVMYLALAAALVVVVWSKMRTWLKTILVSGALSVAVALLVWCLPAIIESENNDALWNTVADVFLVLVAVSLLAACGAVLWSMIRRS